MYKTLKNDLEDKKILEEQILTIDERIKYKIQQELGLHATTYTELKVECLKQDDKFLRVLGKIEKLDKQRVILQGELDLIEREIHKVDELISSMDDISKKVFRCRYIWGLSVRETAERLHYGKDRIKQITREMFNK